MEHRTEDCHLYDFAKTIVALLTVIAHSTIMYTSYGAFSPANGSNLLAMVTEYIYQFHMPMFVFLSGAIYALCIQDGRYGNNADFLWKKTKRLVLPYFIFGFFYVAPAMCLLGLTEQSYLQYCYNGIILSLNSRHLWYLEALFVIFVFAMIVRRLLLHSWKSRIAVLVISALLFFFREHVPPYFQLQKACAYQLYFVCGVMFHFCYKWIYTIFYKIRWIIMLFPIVLLGKFYYNPNMITELFYQYIGIVMMIKLSMYVAEKRETLFKRSWYLCIKKNTMGIYLFHPMIIYGFYYFLGPKDINPYLLSIGIAAMALMLSVLATSITRKLHMGILIGE